MCSVLNRLELRSFKCFELLRLPLAPMTLLTGPNASGKSSVLQALVLMHQTMREHEWSTRLALNGASVRLGTVSEVIGRGGYEFALEDDECAYRWTFAGDRRDMSMEVQSVEIDDRVWPLPKELRYLLPPERMEASEPLTRPLRNLSYITADRIAPQEAHPLEDPRLVRVVGPRGENTASVLHWGRDEPVLDELVLPDAPAFRLRQVELRMRRLFPGCELDLQQTPRANAVSLGLRTSNSTDFHSPVHTGFGLTQILPIIVAALSAEKEDILIVENPEVHLHPAGQAQMGQFLADIARAGVQVIVETHSDHVLNGVRRSVRDSRLTSEQVAIHYFRPRSDTSAQVKSPVLDDSGNIDDWPEGFFRPIRQGCQLLRWVGRGLSWSLYSTIAQSTGSFATSVHFGKR